MAEHRYLILLANRYALSDLLSEVLTANGQLHKQNDTNFEADNIEDKMAEVICTDAVVNPRAVTWIGVSKEIGTRTRRKTYWSCLATQRPHRRQCLLRSGFRDIQGTQKFSSSNFQSEKSSLTVSRCWFLLVTLGT